MLPHSDCTAALYQVCVHKNCHKCIYMRNHFSVKKYDITSTARDGFRRIAARRPLAFPSSSAYSLLLLLRDGPTSLESPSLHPPPSSLPSCCSCRFTMHPFMHGSRRCCTCTAQPLLLLLPWAQSRNWNAVAIITVERLT